MKFGILSICVVILALCLDAKKGGSGKRPKPGTKFEKKGGMVDFCLDGDACTQFIKMRMERLLELNSTGHVVQKAQNFKQAEFEWSAPVLETNDGQNRTKVMFDAAVKVGKPSEDKSTKFKMTTYVYHENGTALNGNQTIDIVENSLKFSIDVTDWPWMADTNKLKFGVNLMVKSRDNKNGTQKPKRKRKGRKGKIDRFELGGGTFMEAPELCVIDGKTGNVSSSTEAMGEAGVALDWIFPYFANSLYYDPVLGESSEEGTFSSDGGSGTTGGDNTSGTASLFSMQSMAYVTIGLMLAAYLQ